MKVIERDRTEGQPYFIVGEDFDMVTGRLMTHDGQHWGWYSVNKLPDSEETIDYNDPDTFETSEKLCCKYAIRRMKVEDTSWQRMDMWIPVDKLSSTINATFDHAMGVINEF